MKTIFKNGMPYIVEDNYTENEVIEEKVITEDEHIIKTKKKKNKKK